MKPSNALQAALVISCACAAPPGPPFEHHRPKQAPVRLLYQYPEGTWIENLAVRPNGNLLLTILTSPHLDQLDPFEQNPQPETLYTFPNASGASGIAEIEEDVFTLAVGNFSMSESREKGGWGVWKVDFNGNKKDETDETPPVIEKITNLPELIFPNGMSNLPPTNKRILLGDIFTGKIWRVDTSTGKQEVVIENELTTIANSTAFGEAGVNGLHVRGEELYFTNTGKGIFASMPIAPSGELLGSPTIISRFDSNSSPKYFDDFTLRGDGALLVTGGGNSVERVALEGGEGVILAGSLNSTQIAEPTRCAFGRTREDFGVLYVVTAGGLASPVDGRIRVGAQVLAVDLREWAWGGGKEDGECGGEW